jgi:hypothetical protein
VVAGCKKLVKIDAPPTATTGENVYNSDATAIAALTGIYTDMSLNSDYFANGFTTLSFFAGLSADEFSLYNGVTNTSQIAYFKNKLSSNPSPSGAGFEFWQKIYSPYIFLCNSAIEGINKSTSLSKAVKNQLLGEAKFMRAFFYFYLVNLYGDVPLVTTTDYKVNSSLPRSSTEEVYNQIIVDLKDAQSSLSEMYLSSNLMNSSAERVRPNKYTATALLARVYLYKRDWSNAESEATTVINNSTLYSLDSLNAVFLKNSYEAIWQLQPVSSGTTNTQDAYLFIIPQTGPDDYHPAYISDHLLNSFESGDWRRIYWIDSVTVAGTKFYYPFKYKVNEQSAPVQEYLMMFRLGEQYLIRAEARAEQGNFTGSNSDLNLIRTRAGLSSVAFQNKSILMTSILHERQVELFAELGHRWLDLKRTNSVDSVMKIVAPQKGGVWSSNWKLYPLPIDDLSKNYSLIQNPGY